MNIKDHFPILSKQVNGKPLVYLDNAATTQKPISVINRIVDYYRGENSNIHRGMHYLSEAATFAYEESRKQIADFINAADSKEIIFTRGTTESINLVADTFGNRFLSENDEIIVTTMEHHSNIVPWQIACEKKKAKLKVVPITQEGTLIIDEYRKLISERTKLVAVAHVSNVLGTINPIKEIISIAHQYDIPVLIDGAQGIPHIPVDVQDLDCDFYCFSGHKMYAPMGIGVLYGKEKWLELLPPYQGGGEMIANVSFEKTTFNELPYKYEAGTPNVEGALSLCEAISFIQQIGYPQIQEHEENILNYCRMKMQQIEGIRFYGESENKSGVISFLIDGAHPFDVGTLLDKLCGIAVRTGHHCAEPLMQFYNIPGTVRASFAIYNTTEDIDRFIEGLRKVKSMLL